MSASVVARVPRQTAVPTVCTDVATPIWLRCDCDTVHPLGGLFVMFRPLAAEPGSRVAVFRDAIAADEADGALHLTARPFLLGVTDSLGWIVPLTGESAAAGRVPDSHKFLLDHEYEFYFIHHPSRAEAERIAALMHVGDESFGAPSRLRVERVGRDAGVRVPVAPERFIPRGPVRYGEWTLHGESALNACKPLHKHVRKLQDDLGRLRYVIGGPTPYTPVARKKPGTGEAKREPLDGWFSEQTLNAVYGFQRDARRGRAFCLSRSPTTPGDYLVGEERAVDGPTPVAEDGVVDNSTADAIGAWIDAHRRRPGRILVPVRANDCWMRDDVAPRFIAWDRIARALGAPGGVVPGSSFRSIYDALDGAKPGKAVKSLHKTGAAVDLAMSNFVPNETLFPVSVSREGGARTRWRLHLEASHPAFALGAPRACADAIIASLIPLRDAALSWETAVSRRIAGEIITALQTNPSEALDAIYDDSTAPWSFDPMDPEGGHALPLRRAPAGSRLLDLTRLAARCDLTGIGALSTWLGGTNVRGSESGKIVEALEACVKGNLPAAWEVVVGPDQKGAAAVAASWKQVDGAFLRAWHTKLQELLPARPASSANPTHAPLRRAGFRVSALLSARPDAPHHAQLIALLNAHPNRQFTGAIEGHAFTGSGSDWVRRLQAAIEGLNAARPALATDAAKGTARADLARAVVEIDPDVRVAAAGPSSGPWVIPPKSTVTLPKAGDSRSAEWWHFQATDAGSPWFSALRELGWHDELLLEGRVPALHGRRGLGYPPGNVVVSRIGLRGEAHCCRPLWFEAGVESRDPKKPLLKDEPRIRNALRWEVVDLDGAPVETERWTARAGRLDLGKVPLTWGGRRLTVRAFYDDEAEDQARLMVNISDEGIERFIALIAKLERAFPAWGVTEVTDRLRHVAYYDNAFWRTMLDTDEAPELSRARFIASPHFSRADRDELARLVNHTPAGGTGAEVTCADAWGQRIAVGHVITGISAGLHRNTNRLFSGLDNLYAVTLAGDLGQSASRVADGRSTQYIAEDFRLTEASSAELVGDIDGLLLGDGASPNATLSAMLHEYYCPRGPGEARHRFARLEAQMAAAPGVLEHQTAAFANWYSTNEHRIAPVLALRVLPSHVTRVLALFRVWFARQKELEANYTAIDFQGAFKE